MPRFKIEWNCGGWEDAGWTEDDKPLRFPTAKAGQRAINSFIKETRDAKRQGYLDSSYRRSDYRVVPVRRA